MLGQLMTPGPCVRACESWLLCQGPSVKGQGNIPFSQSSVPSARFLLCLVAVTTRCCDARFVWTG